jgi:hypothetical protein
VPRGHPIYRQLYVRTIAATHNVHPIIFLGPQSQISLPPDWNTVILARKVGIVPVDVGPFRQRVFRRKRKSCTGRGRNHA